MNPFFISQLLQTAIILNCIAQWSPIFSNIIDLIQFQGERPDNKGAPHWRKINIIL